MSKITFIAETETNTKSISLIVDDDIAVKFNNADDVYDKLIYCYESTLAHKSNIYAKAYFTDSQMRRLKDFFNVCHNVLYKYKLTCVSNKK